MTKRFAVILVAAAMLLGPAQAAHAALAAVQPEPYLAAYGFYPAWYQDSTGLKLELCLSLAVSPNAPTSPMCLLTAPFTVDPVAGVFLDPPAPIVFPVNFGDENFWFMADGTFDLTSGLRMIVLGAVEAAFNTPEVIDGQQITFARIRIRIDVPSPGGTYTITHPYGTNTYTGVAPGRRAINDTVDIGVGAPGVFTGALGGAVGPFLHRSLTPGGAPAHITVGSETFIGDPNIGQFVTGSPFGTNFVRVEGPGIGTDAAFPCNSSPAPADPTNCVENKLFSVSGKIFTALATSVNVDRSTYSRSAAGSHVDVFATSTLGNTLSFRDALTSPTSTPMLGDGSGKFYGQEANPASIPAFVVVTANAPAGAALPASLASPVVDVVKITKAQYALDTHTLRIEATSSDQVAPPTLTAIGLGELAAGALNSAMPQPPARVTVVSSQGGRDTEPVQIVPTLTAAAATTTSITAPAVTFPANGLVTVTVSSAAGTPTGDVSLSVDGGAAVTQALVSGSTTFTLTSPAVGTHSLSASYVPADATFAASSATGSLVVNPAAPAATTTSITAPAVTFPANGLVTVTVSSAAATPTGNVSLSVDGGAAVTQALVSGSTTFTLTSPAVGTHALSASYTGNASFAASSATGSLVVNPAATTTSISAPAVTSPANGLVTVTVSSAAGTPTGNVSLSVDGGAAITQALVGGSTTFTLTSPAVGTHTLSASYAAQGNFAASSAAGSLVVNPAAGAETLTVTTATATIRVLRNQTTATWSVSGTTTRPTGNTITVRTNTGQVIGTARPNRAGAWTVTANNTAIIPAPGATVTATSIFGATSPAFTVTIR